MEWDISKERMIGQRKELACCRDDLLIIKRKVRMHKENINIHWHAEEVREVNEMIDDIAGKLQKICNHIEEIETEISRMAIMQEE